MNGKGLCLQCDRKYIYFENTWPGLWLHVTGLYFYKLSFCVSLYVSCSFSLYVCMVSCAHIHAFTVSWCLMIVFMTKVSYLSLSLVAFPQPLPSECVCVWERELFQKLLTFFNFSTDNLFQLNTFVMVSFKFLIKTTNVNRWEIIVIIIQHFV